MGKPPVANACIISTFNTFLLQILWQKNIEVEIIYCPSGDIPANLLTKQLQGSQYKKFIDTILNLQCDVSKPQTNAVKLIHMSVLRKAYKMKMIMD